MYRGFLVVVFLIVSSYTLLAQQLSSELSGTVYDEKGNPLELVNVAVSGKSEGTFTDQDGQYSLQVFRGLYDAGLLNQSWFL